MDICKMLTISLYHIAAKTFKSLEDGHVYVTSYPIEDGGMLYGFFVRADSKWPDESIPEDLEACMEFALQHDCTWLRLDLDAERVDGLPIYKWEE